MQVYLTEPTFLLCKTHKLKLKKKTKKFQIRRLIVVGEGRAEPVKQAILSPGVAGEGCTVP